MAYYTLEEFAALLTKSFSRYRPRVVYDTNDKGRRVMEFILPHPDTPRFSVSIQATDFRGAVDTCTLWFGQAEITGHLDPDTAVSAIETVISDELVAVLRYKNQAAYDDHRPSGHQWLYQRTDDEDDDGEALAAMKRRLTSPPTLTDRLSGKYTGVFEIFSWKKNELITR